MKKIIILFLISITFYIANAKDVPFKVERMITDFNGVVTNGSNTIAYGDYGIMTYSLDMGQSWKQQNIGDRYSIKKIRTLGNDFIGLTNYSLIKSTDNGFKWTDRILTNEPNLIDFTINDNLLYILTDKSILVSDINLFIQLEPLLLLDKESMYSEMETDGVNLYFIKDNKFLQIYNIVSEELTSVDLLKESNCSNCSFVANLRVTENEISIQTAISISGLTQFPQILKSYDKGKSWNKIKLYLYPDACYKIINNKIHYISPQRAANSSNRNYYVNGYFRVDSSDISLDTNYITWLNPKEKLDRRINSVNYTDFIVNDNNIIAVGKDKLISVSNNNGESFEFKSKYNGEYNGIGNISIVTDSLIYMNYSLEFYKTKDGGITWLPQKYTDYNTTSAYRHPYYSYFDKNGNGFAKFGSINKENDWSALVTFDYGENFQKTDKPEYNIPYYNYFKKNVINLGDKFIFIINPVKLTDGSYSYSIIRYDKSLNFLDSINLETDKIVNIKRVNDDNIIALVVKSTGSYKIEVNGDDDYSYKYYLIQSKDKGATWNNLIDSVPVRQLLYNDIDGTSTYLEVILDESILYNDYVIFPTQNKIIYRYNYVNNVFDSIPYPGDNSFYTPYALFQVDNYLFSVSNLYENTVYYTKDQDYENTTWDSLAGKDIFADWDQFDYSKKYIDTDAILEAKMLSNSFGYLVIGKCTASGFGTYVFNANFVKITSNTTTDVVENDYQIENERAFLWNSSPYPIPGKSVIKSDIYWSNAYTLSDIQLNVFDINGEKLIKPNININPNNSFSGVLVWDCAGVSSGVYVIQVLLNGESINFPVVISK